MVISQANFLDFGSILINELVGDVWLTLLVGLIVIAFICIQARVPWNGIISIQVLYVFLILSSFPNELVLFMLIFLVVGTGYLIISKMIRR